MTNPINTMTIADLIAETLDAALEDDQAISGTAILEALRRSADGAHDVGEIRLAHTLELIADLLTPTVIV